MDQGVQRLTAPAAADMQPTAEEAGAARQAGAASARGPSQLHESLRQVLGEKATAAVYWEKPVVSGSVLAGCLVVLLAMRFYTLTHLLTTLAGGHLMFSKLKNAFRRVSDSELSSSIDRLRVDSRFEAASSRVNAAVGWYLTVTNCQDPLAAALLFATFAILWVSSCPKLLTVLSHRKCL